MFAAGIDACPQGWSVVFYKENKYFAQEYTSLKDIMEENPDLDSIAIDMIIGLPVIAHKGGRVTDRAARKLLSPRSSVVFSAPCRSAVYAKDYQEALQNSRKSGENAIGLSKQTYNITPKIKELDTLIRADEAIYSRIYEVHPELSFWELNQRAPLSSKHSKEGQQKRIELLEKASIPCTSLLKSIKHSKDLIDACACLWSAIRLHKKQALHTPVPPAFDAHNLRMLIYW